MARGHGEVVWRCRSYCTQEAKQALAVYAAVTDKAARQVFLDNFEQNGGGEGSRSFQVGELLLEVPDTSTGD